MAGGGMPKMGGGGASKMGGGGARRMGGGGPGGGAPNPRTQLLNLIDTLDRVLDRQVAVTLSADDRAAVAAQLKGLDDAKEVTNDEAKAKLDAILQVVEKDRPALEATGYRWPVAGPKDADPPRTGATSNPFQIPQTAAKIRSLTERLQNKK